MASVEIGNLKILNVTQNVPAGTDLDFVMTVPPGGVGELMEATYHLFRGGVAAPTAQPGNSYDPFTSDLIRIKNLQVTKVGSSERTSLLSGTPNIKEFAGDGKLARLFTVIETLENNEDIRITVHNDDTVTVEVSITLTLAIKPREREIAGQPYMERPGRSRSRSRRAIPSSQSEE